MEENESVNLFLRVLQERHELVKVRFNELFKTMSSDNHEGKVKANGLLLEACEELLGSLSSSDRPQWLGSLINESRSYNNNHNVDGHNFRLLNNLVNHRNNVLHHTWSFEKSGSEVDFNFDRVYNQHKQNSKLPEFFDALIDTLQKIIDSGEIDSLTVLKSLEQLISVIKQNKAGSYFSVMASWEFISKFTKNLIWQELGKLSGIKQLKSAFEKTVKEMDIELVEMHKSISKEMKDKFDTTINSITHRRLDDNLLEHKTSEK